MEVRRYRFTARRSEWVFQPEERDDEVGTKAGYARFRTELAERQRRLDAYRELASRGLPMELMPG